MIRRQAIGRSPPRAHTTGQGCQVSLLSARPPFRCHSGLTLSSWCEAVRHQLSVQHSKNPTSALQQYSYVKSRPLANPLRAHTRNLRWTPPAQSKVATCRMRQQRPTRRRMATVARALTRATRRSQRIQQASLLMSRHAVLQSAPKLLSQAGRRGHLPRPQLTNRGDLGSSRQSQSSVGRCAHRLTLTTTLKGKRSLSPAHSTCASFSIQSTICLYGHACTHRLKPVVPQCRASAAPVVTEWAKRRWATSTRRMAGAYLARKPAQNSQAETARDKGCPELLAQHSSEAVTGETSDHDEVRVSSQQNWRDLI